MSSFDNLSLKLPSKISDDSKIFDNNLTIFDSEINLFTNEPIITPRTFNLYELLLSNINVPSYNLTPDQINWINDFIKASPASIEKIISDLKTISSTGEIELTNIPQIVKICADIYYSGAINYNLVNPDNIIVLIKFTIDVILNSQLIIVSNVEKEIIQTLVDTSLTLLSMNITNIDTEIHKIKSISFFMACFKFFKSK